MAPKKPRIQVSLDPETYGLLRELADLQGESMSSIVAGVLDASVPVLVNLREAARRYEHLSATAKAEMMDRWQSAESKLLPHVEVVQEEWLALTNPDQDPRPVTRGSRPPASPSPHGLRAVK